MTKVAVIYFSGYGHTQKQAEAVAEGVKGAGADARLIAIPKEGDLSEADWSALDEAQAIIYGSPTYMGGVAWQFKKFAEASSKRWYQQAWKDKIAGGFTNSATVNGDKAATMFYLFTFAQQHSQIWVGTGLMPANAKANGPDDVNWTGGSQGALAVSPSDASADEAPRKGDLETARLYGARIAGFAKRLRA